MSSFDNFMREYGDVTQREALDFRNEAVRVANDHRQTVDARRRAARWIGAFNQLLQDLR